MNAWKTAYTPEFNPGGLHAVNIAVASRLFDNFESYADSAALQAVWTTTAVTRTLETVAPLRGAKSMNGVVTNATNQVKRNINNAIFEYPFPKRLRYITFKATVDSGTAAFTVKIWGSANEANNYKEWSVQPKDQFNDIIIDIDDDNQEGFPTVTTGAAYEPTTINRFSFEDLTNGRTYYFDDIVFYYEYSLLDAVGFGTEPPIAIGTDGSVHGRLNSIHADVLGLQGQTQQYAKQGIAVAEIGQALQWALELNSDFAPPDTTEISPGTYDIDRVRLGVTTNMVNDAAASESAGTIYASYTPAEADWNVGDLIKVTFSTGFIRTDSTPNVALTATLAALGTTVTVANAYAFEAGWLVKIVDDNTAAEWHTIASIDSPTTFTIDAAVGEFTVAQNATVRRAIRTDLTTAVFFTMLQTEAQSFKILATGTLTTSSATVPADTGRTEANNYWNGSWLMPITGAVVNQPRLIASFANAGGVFTLDAQQPFTAVPGLVEYIVIGNNSQLVPAADATSNQTPAHVVGNKADVAVYAASATASVIAYLKGVLGAAVIGTGTLTTSSATVPADTGRAEADNYWRGSWLMTLTGAVAFQPRLITSFANTGGIFTLDAQHPFTAAPGTVTYILLSPNQSIVPAADATTNTTPAHVTGNKSDAIPAMNLAPGTDSIVAHVKAILERVGATPADPDDSLLTTVGQRDDAVTVAATASIVSLLRDLIAGLSIVASGVGGGFEIDGSPSLVTALGTTGAVVTDSATSVLGVSGANNNNNAFDSSSVVANSNGSILERLEHILVALGGTTGTTSALGTTSTAIDTVARLEANDYWNGGVFICVDGTNAGLARPIYDFVNATGTLYFEPAFPNAVAASVNYLILTRFDVARILGDNNANNAYDSSNIVENRDGSVLERLEYLFGEVEDDSDSVENRIGNLTARVNDGSIATALGLDNLPDVASGDLYNILWKYLANTAISAPTTKTGLQYLQAIGSNDASNDFDSSTVIANEDGSVLERLEDIDLGIESLGDVSLADFDNFDVADADANTERWDVGYLNGTEGGSADINTTTAGKLRVAVDPDASPTAAGYGVHLAQSIVSKYFTSIVDVDSTFGGANASWATVGMRVSPTTYDTNNVVYIQRQESSGAPNNRFTAGAILNGIQSGEVSFTTADNAFAFKIERWDNVWRCYYSLTQSPNFVWVLLQQYEDPSEFMDAQQSIYLDAYSPGNVDAQTAIADFDNFKLYITQQAISQEIAGDYDSSVVVADEDGSALERLEQIQEAVNRGSGTSIAANKSLVDALGSDGTTVTDSAVSVLGAIGADNANNAFASTNVAENGDGSVLERLEEIRGRTSTATHNIEVAHATAEQTVSDITPIRHGRIAVEFDVNTLVAAGEGGTVIVRLKSMIDGANLRTISRADFIVGTDDAHPTVDGWVYEGASTARVTIQVNSAVGAQRAIQWRIIESA